MSNSTLPTGAVILAFGHAGALLLSVVLLKSIGAAMFSLAEMIVKGIAIRFGVTP
jgi:hypothetical protein